MVSEIYLLRHGQASFGAEDYDRLSEAGETQARLLGEHLAELGMEFDAIFSGAMRRQRDTARILLEGMGHSNPEGFEIMDHFNEFDHLLQTDWIAAITIFLITFWFFVDSFLINLILDSLTDTEWLSKVKIA